MKFRIHDKVATASALITFLLVAYALMFIIQELLYAAFALFSAALVFYTVWQLLIYLKNFGKEKNKTQLVIFLVSLVLCLAVIFLSIMCYTGNWFVIG